MARIWSGGQLVIATHNPGKLSEIAELLAPFGVETRSVAIFSEVEPEETGATFAANAAIKAQAAAALAGLPALADDSGLVVPALDGQPGIHSARWAGPSKDFRLAMEKVEQALQGRADRAAHFICVLCLAWPDGETATFEGRVEGRLVWPPRGTQGFGYDPIFQPRGQAVTFGEMAPAEKHAMSHRARAFAQLVDAVFRPS